MSGVGSGKREHGDGAAEIMAKGPFCMGCLGDRCV